MNTSVPFTVRLNKNKVLQASDPSGKSSSTFNPPPPDIYIQPPPPPVSV